jgi:carboxyl-terminal processing protease
MSLTQNKCLCIAYLHSLSIFRFIFHLAIFLSFTFSLFSQQATTTQKANMIIKTAQKYHFKPKPIDDAFSQLVFDNCLDYLDVYQIYFTQSDFAQLEKSKLTLDEAILQENNDFIQLTASLYQKSLSATDSLLRSFRNRKFDFYLNDTLIFTDKTKYRDTHEWVYHWEKLVKLRAMTNYLDNSVNPTTSFPSNEELSVYVEKILTSEIDRIQSKLNFTGGITELVGLCYLKSIATAFDPHSEYFTESEEQSFNNALSKEFYTFGFSVTKNDIGNIEISEIVPGGAAWNSNLLNEGDIILKVKAKGYERKFDNITLYEVLDFLNKEDLEEATFDIRKMDGKEISLTLHKDNQDVQKNIIQSFLLEGSQKIGYIYIPSFYSEFDAEQYNLNGCANDLAKELIQLKKEGINGLILDLRNNGGGSMMEAILMSGIFVDFGAISIFQIRDQDAVTLKDMNKGTIYNSPLIILINEYSASASELFAAAMQDHNRAVIVGSHSYGKSTAQVIMPLDAYKEVQIPSQKNSPLGYLKITNGVFYRVTGKSHQKVGVIPDVPLTSLYDGIELGEITAPSALEPFSIDKNTYFMASKILPIQMLSERSTIRLAQNPLFKQISRISILNIQKEKLDAIPLQFQAFQTFFKEEEKQIVPLNESQTDYKVSNPTYRQGLSSMVELDKENNDNTQKIILEDLYIWEAYHIITDLINMYKN